MSVVADLPGSSALESAPWKAHKALQLLPKSEFCVPGITTAPMALHPEVSHAPVRGCRPKGSVAATKCHAAAKVIDQQGFQLKNPPNWNLPVNDRWAIHKSHDRITISDSSCPKTCP